MDKSKNRKVTVEFDYQFILEKITIKNLKVPDEIERNNKIYSYQAEVIDNRTRFKLSRKFRGKDDEINEKLKKKIIHEIFEVVNNFLSQIRTFYHLTSNFHFVSPTTIDNCKISFVENESIISSEKLILKSELPENVELYFDVLNDSPYEDWWDVIMEDNQVPHIPLLMDGVYLFNEHKYNECIINCCTSVESYIFPKLIEYFKNLTLSKSEKVAKEIVMNISMATRYEILFGTIDNEFLGNMPNLLKELKQMTKIRNGIIHSGRKGKRFEAWKALDFTAKMFAASYMKMEDLND